MNIVVLTGPYHPVMGPASSCINIYIQKLKYKHNVIILCQKSSSKKNTFYDEKISVHYITNFVNNIRCFCSDYKCNKIVNLLLILVRLYGFIKSFFSYPTRKSWLIDKYYNKLCELEKDLHIDLIISVSNPVCTHLAVKKYKKKNNSFKWITYNTDPFTYYTKSYKNVFDVKKRFVKNYKTEKSYYLDSDCNIFTEELYNHSLKKFKLLHVNNICFPYVLTDFNISILKSESDNKLCKLVYAGSFNKEIRNPDYALSILKEVKGICVQLYQSGDCNEIIKKHSCSHIKVFNTLTRSNYINLILGEADILINIGNSSRLQAPSKMLELLSTGKPIVNFYIYKNSHYDMINHYPLGLNIGIDEVNPVKLIEDFCFVMKGKRLSYDKVKQIFPNNVIDNQLKIIDNIISDK